VTQIKNPALGEGLPDRGFLSAKGKTLNNQQPLGMFAILVSTIRPYQTLSAANKKGQRFDSTLLSYPVHPVYPC